MPSPKKDHHFLLQIQHVDIAYQTIQFCFRITKPLRAPPLKNKCTPPPLIVERPVLSPNKVHKLWIIDPILKDFERPRSPIKVRELLGASNIFVGTPNSFSQISKMPLGIFSYK